MIEEFKKSCPSAYDRLQKQAVPPDPRILTFMARLREEQDSEEGSSPDEGPPPKNAGHRGRGSPVKVGVGKRYNRSV